MSTRRNGNGAWVWLVLFFAVVLTVLLTPDATKPYDLDSADPSGYRGLRLLLEQTGTAVERIDAADVPERAGADDSDGKVAVVYVPVADSADASLVARWRRFVTSGGRLVVGTPVPDLGAQQVANGEGDPEIAFDQFGAGEGTVPGVCDINELSGARGVMGLAVAPLLDASDGRSCYGDGDSALIVREEIGDGVVFTLASPDVFANEPMGAPGLDEKVTNVPDNAVVAQRLLGSAASVSVVTSGLSTTPVSTGAKSLTDYLPSGVKLALLQLLVAFGFYAWHRGRRHGKVVIEPAAVSISGSDFVDAHGNLLERQSQPERAAAAMRSNVLAELCQRLGMPAGISPTDATTVVAQRTGRDPAAVAALFTTTSIANDRELFELSTALESLRQEALHV